jgi:pyruvate dehydrogenase E1 component alpha subunit
MIMPERIVAEFRVKYLQVLDEHGNVDRKLEPKLTCAQLKELFRLFILTRTYDDTALSLQREGRIGTYASSRGEEACIIGPAFAMQKNDWLVPSYREHGAYLARGLPMENLFIHWGGSEDGNKIPEGQRNMTIAIPIGTQTLHAVGIAWAAKLRKEKCASLVFFGDGATSTGDFHEAMNFAGVFRTPVVFLCRNNRYAISVPRDCTNSSGCQTRAATLAQKAIAYGIDCMMVDGNDVLACYSAAATALGNARAGRGPSFIEAVTYRMGAHTTADDPARYRSAKEVAAWAKKDPLTRLRQYLKARKIWTALWEKNLIEKSRKQVDGAVRKYEQHKSAPADMFMNVFAQLPQHLKEQMEYIGRFGK